MDLTNGSGGGRVGDERRWSKWGKQRCGAEMAHLIAEEKSSGEVPRYRVWHAYNVPNNMRFYAVSSPAEAKTLIAKLAKADLSDASIVSNAFGLEELADGEYSEWYDAEGKSIEEG